MNPSGFGYTLRLLNMQIKRDFMWGCCAESYVANTNSFVLVLLCGTIWSLPDSPGFLDINECVRLL